MCLVFNFSCYPKQKYSAKPRKFAIEHQARKLPLVGSNQLPTKRTAPPIRYPKTPTACPPYQEVAPRTIVTGKKGHVTYPILPRRVL
jgi:hypothetical protein